MPKINKLRVAGIAGMLIFAVPTGWSLLGFVRLIQAGTPLVTALQTDSFIFLVVCSIVIGGFGALLHISGKPVNSALPQQHVSSNPANPAASPASTVAILSAGTTLVFNGKENGELQMFTLPSDAWALPKISSSKPTVASGDAQDSAEKQSKPKLFTKVIP